MRSYDVTVFDGPLSRNDRPTPEPQGEEVLVKITAAGVCHSKGGPAKMDSILIKEQFQAQRFVLRALPKDAAAGAPIPCCVKTSSH